MTALTAKQRVKVNAALAIIHDHGHSANAISQAARTHVARGFSAARSYEMAINEFAKSQPDIGVALVKATRLVEASDDATVARYDAALDQYISTGDNSALVAAAPMIIQDSIALAVATGELSPEDATGPQAFEIAMGTPPQNSADKPNGEQSASPMPERSISSGPSAVNDRQASPVGVTGLRAPLSPERAKAWAGTPTGGAGIRTASGGYRAPMTGERAARWHGVPLNTQAGKAAMAAEAGEA